MRVVIIDYQTGNIRSVARSIELLGGEYLLTRDIDEIQRADRLILPGVGGFRQGMDQLREFGLVKVMKEQATEGKPILGICLGMQLFADWSEENGGIEGLGLISGKVIRFPDRKQLRVPHMGWNDITFKRNEPLFAGIPQGADFYFCHSYHFQCRDDQEVVATVEYGGAAVCAVKRQNVIGVQFHPEKSFKHGERLLANFLENCSSAAGGGDA